MNIAFLTNMLSKPTDSGGNIHVMQMANRLLERGHRLFTNLWEESDDFVKFRPDDFENTAREIDAFYIRVHGHQGNDELTALRQYNLTAPCIWEINAPLEELLVTGCSYAAFEAHAARRRELARSVDAAICVSLEMQNYALSDLQIPFTTCIPNGSDVDRFGRVAERGRRDSFTIIWVGSAKFPWQGFELVRRAAEIVSAKDSSVQFIVTAEGTPTSNVKFIGHVPYDDLPELLASADVGLCVYEDITFFKEFFFSPLKMYDYMAAGLPVIGSNRGQIKKVISETRNGLLVDDVNQLADAILQLKQNESAVRSMGSRSRMASEMYYSWDRVCTETEIFLETAIKVKKLCKNSLSLTMEYQHIRDYILSLENKVKEQEELLIERSGTQRPFWQRLFS